MFRRLIDDVHTRIGISCAKGPLDALPNFLRNRVVQPRAGIFNLILDIDGAGAETLMDGLLYMGFERHLRSFFPEFQCPCNGRIDRLGIEWIVILVGH